MAKVKKFLTKTFFNDDDGFSAKDFLMVLIVGLFAIFLAVAFFAPFFGALVSPISIGVIESMSTVVMTIVGGVFAVQTVKEFRSPTESTPETKPVVEEEEKHII